MDKEYIIMAPPYAKNNGIKVHYLLYSHLRARGQKVRICAPPPHQEGFDYIEPEEITAEVRKNSIAVYSEIIWGNPLHMDSVVRYVLYYPGVIGGSKEYDPSEFIVTYHPDFYPSAFKLTIPCIDTTVFYDDHSEKKQDCYFVHKYGKFREVPELEGAVEINMQYPATQKELADLLRTTKTLYSFDPHTVVAAEATRCGAKVKFITPTGFMDYQDNYDEVISDFEVQMEKFIKISQSRSGVRC